MTKSQILTLNERLKTVSNYLSNLSAALLAASVARVWTKSNFDLATATWLAVSGALIALAYGMLYLLEPDT